MCCAAPLCSHAVVTTSVVLQQNQGEPASPAAVPAGCLACVRPCRRWPPKTRRGLTRACLRPLVDLFTSPCRHRVPIHHHARRWCGHGRAGGHHLRIPHLPGQRLQLPAERHQGRRQARLRAPRALTFACPACSARMHLCPGAADHARSAPFAAPRACSDGHAPEPAHVPGQLEPFPPAALLPGVHLVHHQVTREGRACCWAAVGCAAVAAVGQEWSSTRVMLTRPSRTLTHSTLQHAHGGPQLVPPGLR